MPCNHEGCLGNSLRYYMMGDWYTNIIPIQYVFFSQKMCHVGKNLKAIVIFNKDRLLFY